MHMCQPMTTVLVGIVHCSLFSQLSSPFLEHNIDGAYLLTIGDKGDNASPKYFQNFICNHLFHGRIRLSFVLH